MRKLKMPEKILGTYVLNANYDWSQIPNADRRGMVFEVVDRISGEHMLRSTTASIELKLKNLFYSYSGRRGIFSIERFRHSRIDDIIVNVVGYYPGELTGEQFTDQERVNKWYQDTFWPETDEE